LKNGIIATIFMSKPGMDTENKHQESMNLLSSLIGLYKYCLRKWWLFLLFAILGGGLGYWYSSSKEPLFEGRLSFALEDNSGGGGLISGAMGLASELGLSMGASQDIFGGENILPILSSRKIIERVLMKPDPATDNKKTFADSYIDLHLRAKLPKTIKNLSIPLGLERDKFSLGQDSLLFIAYNDIIKKRLFAGKKDRRYSIFEVTFQSQDQGLSLELLNNIVKETTIFYTELRTEKSKNLLSVLESRVNSLKGNLSASISRQGAVRDANVNPVFSSSLTPILTEEVNKRAYGEAYATLFANLEMARLQYLKDVPLLQIIDEPRYPLKKLQKSVPIYTVFGFVMGGILIGIGLLLSYFMRKNAKT
jgi:uncharacterized protein involved in exopolysaccharide biosynthesis